MTLTCKFEETMALTCFPVSGSVPTYRSHRQSALKEMAKTAKGNTSLFCKYHSDLDLVVNFRFSSYRRVTKKGCTEEHGSDRQ